MIETVDEYSTNNILRHYIPYIYQMCHVYIKSVFPMDHSQEHISNMSYCNSAYLIVFYTCGISLVIRNLETLYTCIFHSVINMLSLSVKTVNAL